MNKDIIIEKAIDFVKETLSGAEGGHDWWHTYRVLKVAEQLAAKESADLFAVQLGALLHDIADAKFHNGNEEIGPYKARAFMETAGVDQATADHVVKIIRNVSFGGGNTRQTFHSPELAIVQDADRLDAIGAIGIARTFNYGGHKGRELYNPDIAPNLNMTKEEYRNSNSPTINHFFEKLLLLKERMNTGTGKAMAEQRHRFMEQYLEQFYAEWQGVL